MMCNKKATMLTVTNEVMSLQLEENSVRCTLLNLKLDVGNGCNSWKTNWKHMPH